MNQKLAPQIARLKSEKIYKVVQFVDDTLSSYSSLFDYHFGRFRRCIALSLPQIQLPVGQLLIAALLQRGCCETSG